MAKDYKTKTGKRRDLLDDTSFGYKGKPENETNVKDYISLKALRNLPKSSYALLADPYSAMIATSAPYPLLNVFNKTAGGTFKGNRNIDGGNVQQYANSNTSKFLSYFDVMRTQIAINYRYLPILTSAGVKGKALVDEMRRSIAESVSILQSTTYTQMAINNFAVVTDLPMGSAVTTDIGSNSKPIQAYINKNDVLYAMSIYYQIVLQNALNTFNFHNSFRLKQGTMIRNAWNREVPILNSFFGLMNKKAFLSQWDSVGLIFEGEYLDLDFAKQASMLNVMPSRRSNSIIDPVLELQTSFNHPKTFKVYLMDNNGKAIGDPIFDDADMKFVIGTTTDSQGKKVTQYMTYWEALEDMNDYLSMEATTLWARQTTFDPTKVGQTDQARYNIINRDLRGVISCMNFFKPKWADYREALDTTSRAGIVSWTKGFRPRITKDTDASIFRNLLIDNIYQLIFSGAKNITMDDATKRWRTFSLWNMYTGIPEYDSTQGGAFLTYSFKDITGTDSDNLQEYMPVVFNSVSATSTILNIVCVAVSRDGKEAIIQPKEVTMSSQMELVRLAPLASQANEVLRVPSVSFTNNSGLTKAHFSCLYKQLMSVFGLGCVQYYSSGAYSYGVDSDILAIYQIEIEDTTNEAITYARANAPFRGTQTYTSILGFFGTGMSREQ